MSNVNKTAKEINKTLKPILKQRSIPERALIALGIKLSLKILHTMKLSWKTTLGGILTAIGLSLSALEDPTLKLIGTIAAAVGAFLTGVSARDNNVTSEDAGAK